MKRKSIIFRTLLGVIFFIGISVVASSQETTCNSCSDCSAKLNGDYEVVKLNADIVCSGYNSCIEFNANNVEFDCQGHLIEGGELGVYTDGISIDFKSGNTLRNCVVTKFRFGFSLGHSYNNTLTNNTLSNNNYGAYLGYSYNNTLTGNTANSNDYNGIFFYYSIYNTLTGNQVNLNNYYGIYIENSYNNTLNSNRVCSNTGSDFYLYSGSGNSGDENTCDTTSGWNDEGTTGCTYSCGQITTTTTTIQGVPGDTDGNGDVSDLELLTYIEQWSQGLVEDVDLLTAIGYWAT